MIIEQSDVSLSPGRCDGRTVGVGRLQTGRGGHPCCGFGVAAIDPHLGPGRNHRELFPSRVIRASKGLDSIHGLISFGQRARHRVAHHPR